MSDRVLARKYRPRSFDGMVGQEHVVQALANALGTQRLHHAYLFTGTRGVGKTTVSRILAKCLNCVGADGRGGITAQPCGACPSCREIDAGRFPDYTELDAASNRGVEEVSQLLEQAVYKPVVGRFKVFMIDEVHMLTGHAFNAMLKTLEEPPEYLKFVLATTDPQKLPATVLSRCLQFNLRPMAPETIVAHLGHVLNEERIEAEPAALKLIARAAHGSMRDAQSLADQAIAYGAGALREAEVRQMLGSVGRASVFALLDALAASDGAGLVAIVDALREQGASAEGTLEEMAVVLQELAVAQQLADTIDDGDPEAAALAERVELLPADELQLLYSLALHGRAELALAPDEYGGLTMLLLRMLAFRPTSAAPAKPKAAPLVRSTKSASTAVAAKAAEPAPPQHAARPVVVEKKAAEPAAPADAGEPGVPPWMEDIPYEDEPAPRLAAPQPAVPAATAAASPASFEPTPAGDRWAALVRELVAAETITALPRALALQAQCLSLDDDEHRVVLRTDSDSLRQSAHLQKLQAALAAKLGHPVEIEMRAGPVSDSVALRDAAERTRRQSEAQQAIDNDPLVIQLTARYPGARIVPGSVRPL
ncbi:MAG TPA: DNA polymerase III subunit gamma/tau [Methylibium sp.]|uniref:DNA polymerase III subunit gamma/tau n=1 Tax=Methylibium sp. TaxID=2067992 RepID=UPI002DBC6230|nr:DNA polymerase III subunit gamma/tau [Methylibium sp.]HEU4459449.1 DNA polymerase III subunit gamma/tau [Methylibium sp.]